MDIAAFTLTAAMALILGVLAGIPLGWHARGIADLCDATTAGPDDGSTGP